MSTFVNFEVDCLKKMMKNIQNGGCGRFRMSFGGGGGGGDIVSMHRESTDSLINSFGK